MNLPITQIDENQNYWLVRTQSGEFYQEFYLDKFIGIGWNEFNDHEFLKEADTEVLIEKIRKQYPEEKMPGLILNQLRRFVLEMKPGDIVLIPSHSSTHISFGRIESDVYIQKVKVDDVLEGMCHFEKRRRVTWIKTIKRDDLDPYLYRLLYSHHTITDAKEYEQFIDRTLHSLYIKDEKAYLVLRVTTQNRIFAKDILNIINGTLSLIEEFNQVTDSALDTRELELKINVQSPGPIEFSGTIDLILSIGLILVFIVGGKIEISSDRTAWCKISGSTDGLIEKILKFVEVIQKNQTLKQQTNNIAGSMNALQVKIPEELSTFSEKEPK